MGPLGVAGLLLYCIEGNTTGVLAAVLLFALAQHASRASHAQVPHQPLYPSRKKAQVTKQGD